MQAILLLLAACCPLPPQAAPTSSAPTVRLELTEPWTLARQTDETLTIRLGDSPEGVRIQLLATATHEVGTSPILGGRPLVTDHWPMVAPGFAPVDVEVRTEGPDLLVRLTGPPLDQLTAHPDAPSDPALSWLRLRPRGQTWRIIMDGLGTVSLPAVNGAAWTSEGLALGEIAVLTTSASRHRSRWHDGLWQLDTTPAIDAADPYPRTAFTLTVP